MLGHLKPSFCKSSVESKENYWEFYCSVCASLRKQHGTSYSLVLNNEITLILSAFQEEYAQAQTIQTACPASAFVMKRFSLSHQAIDMGAHLSVLLAWIKALDWYSDKPNIFKKILLQRLYRRAKKILPALQPESQTIVGEYARITENNEQDFRLIRQQSNALARMLVQEIALKVDALPETTTLLADLFGRAGELIAIADHLIDLEKDQQHDQYNPIVLQSEKKQIPLAQAYLQLKGEYYALRHSLFPLLAQTNQTFAEAFRRSIHHLDSQIDKNLPACMHTEEAKQLVGKMQIAQTSFAHLPSSMPPPNGCCNEACIGACIGGCCQLCAQGCCQDLCDSCCDSDCFSDCGSGSGNGNSSTSAERKARREQRKAEREAKRKAKEEEKAQKNKDKDKKKTDKDKDDDDVY
jgi:hypothetical protein